MQYRTDRPLPELVKSFSLITEEDEMTGKNGTNDLTSSIKSDIDYTNNNPRRGRMREDMKTHQSRLTTVGPEMKIIARDAMPSMARRGREAFIISLPFWTDLVDTLSRGLTPAQAIEIDLKPVKDSAGKHITEEQLEQKIRYQFHKTGLSEKFSILSPKGSKQLFIVDHETAAMNAA